MEYNFPMSHKSYYKVIQENNNNKYITSPNYHKPYHGGTKKWSLSTTEASCLTLAVAPCHRLLCLLKQNL